MTDYLIGLLAFLLFCGVISIAALLFLWALDRKD